MGPFETERKPRERVEFLRTAGLVRLDPSTKTGAGLGLKVRQTSQVQRLVPTLSVPFFGEGGNPTKIDETEKRVPTSSSLSTQEPSMAKR